MLPDKKFLGFVLSLFAMSWHHIIPSPITKLYRKLVANVRGTRDMERLEGVPRERVSSRYCVKQAMDGLFVAKQLLYRVLNNN